MRLATTKRISLITGTILAACGMAVVPAAAVATRPGLSSPVAAATTTDNSAKTDAQDQAKLKLIISRGDKEIDRRLKTLNTLDSKINSAKKLSSSDKSTLSAEVNNEISALTSLKTKLDADTDLTTAKTDAQSIFSGYRVYALVVPKVQLVKTADDQQAAEGRLTALASKLQSRIGDAKQKGKDVTSLQASLDDLNAKTTAAQAVSSSIESSVINLQPSDYNSNHTILGGDRDKLTAAQNDIKAAVADAKTIVSGLKNQ